MKIMYVSKIDCKYLWSTISETKDECEAKTKILEWEQVAIEWNKHFV